MTYQHDRQPAAIRFGFGRVQPLNVVRYAFDIVLMRQQALVAGPIEIALPQSLVVAVLLSIGAPHFSGLPDARHAPLILLAAPLAVGSLLLLAWAYARGSPLLSDFVFDRRPYR